MYYNIETVLSLIGDLDTLHSFDYHLHFYNTISFRSDNQTIATAIVSAVLARNQKIHDEVDSNSTLVIVMLNEYI